MLLRGLARRVAVAGGLLVCALVAAPALGAGNPGDVDPTFNGNGSAYLLDLLPHASSSPYTSFDDVMVDGLHRTIAAGDAAANHSGAPTRQTLGVLVRLRPDGTTDPNFGASGVVQRQFDDRSNLLTDVFGVLRDPTGRIGAGAAIDGSNAGAAFLASARFDDSGGLDSTYASGQAEKASGSAYFNPAHVLDGSDGSTVFVGWDGATSSGTMGSITLVKLAADGTPDTTFGNHQGFASIGLANFTATARDAALLPDGRILITGAAADPNSTSHQVLMVARFTATGALDTTFGSGLGYAVAPSTSVAGNSSTGQALAIAPDGSLFVAGVGTTSAVVAKFSADGVLVSGFGTGGVVSLAPATLLSGGTAASATAIAVQTDGLPVLAGWTQVTSGTTKRLLVLARLTSAGTLDSSFGSGGVSQPAVDPVSSEYDTPHRAVIADGKLVVVGNVGSTQLSGLSGVGFVDRYILHTGAGTPPTLQQGPTMSGRPQPAFTLTCNPGQWTNNPTLTYYWQKATYSASDTDTASGVWNTLSNSSSDPKKLTLAGGSPPTSLVGSRVRCVEVATNGDGSDEAPAPSLRVDNDVPILQSVPSLSGTPTLGSTFTCDPGQWTNGGVPTFTYRWTADGQTISGADRSTLLLGSDERRHHVTCEVTASNDLGSSRPATPDGTAPLVVGKPPANHGLPAVTIASIGPKATDQRATCNPGAWDEDYGQYTYQWLREDAPIAGATGATYDATIDDLGRLLACQVVSTNPLGGGDPATSRPILVPLPAAGPAAEVFAAGGGQPGGGNKFDPVNLLAVSADEINALGDLATSRLQDGITNLKNGPCKGTSALGVLPKYSDLIGELLTQQQTCRILRNDPGHVTVVPDGAYWHAGICGARAGFGQTPQQRAIARGNSRVNPVTAAVALLPSCPKLAIPVPGIDPARPPTLDPATAAVVQQYLPKEILWDVDNDGRVDSTCGPTAPVLRSLYETGVYSIRAVIVEPDSAQTGVYPVATYPLSFFAKNGEKGQLRPAQPFVCRTSIDPPPEPKLPCIGEAQIGRVHLVGNLCPISLRTIPEKELEALPQAVQDVLKDQALNTALRSKARTWQPGLPDYRAGAGSVASQAGALTNAMGEFASPPNLSVPKTWSNSLAKLKGFADDKEQYALDQIYLAQNALSVNGIDLTPVGDAATVLVPSDAGEAIDSVKDMTISDSNVKTALGDVPLTDPQALVTDFTDDAKAQAQQFLQSNLDKLKDAASKLDLGPFKLAGDVSVKLEDDGTATLKAHAELPALTSGPGLGPIRTDITLHADLDGNIKLTGLHIVASSAYLFALSLKDMDLTYNGDGLTVKGKILFPWAGNVGLDVKDFELDSTGKFKALDVALLLGAGEGIPVGPGLFITQLGAGLHTDPNFELDGSGAISVGPSAGGGCPTAGITAELHVIFGPGPFEISANGTVGLLCIDIANLDFEAYSNGNVHFGGSASLNLGPAYVSASANATINLPDFQFDVDGQGGIRDVLTGEVKALISSAGIAACGRVEVADLGPLGDVTLAGGLGVHFIHGIPPLNPVSLIAGLDLFTGCDLTPFSPFGRDARAAQDGAGRIITLDGKSQVQALSVIGSGGVPKVRLRAPNGTEYDYTQTGQQLVHVGDRTSAMADPAHGRLIILIAKPQAGDWTLTPDPTSVPIADVLGASKLPAPKVSAKVGGIGASRILSYKVTKQKGQVVRLVEFSGHALRRIVTVKGGGSGTRRFVTSESTSTKRTIVAQVLQNGLPRADLVVAHFTAPSPKVGRAHVRLARHGTTVTVRWSPAQYAARYEVVVSQAGRTVQLLRPKPHKRTVTVKHVPKTVAVTARVVGISAGQHRGPKATGRLKAKRPRKHRRAPHH